MLEENKKYILVRRVYQNTQEVVIDQLRKIKYTRLKKSDSVFSNNEGLIGKENSI